MTVAEKDYEVVYRIHVYAEDPEAAAEKVAALLADGGAERGFYEVTETQTHTVHGIDLGEDEF